jgi:hypothetical protein
VPNIKYSYKYLQLFLLQELCQNALLKIYLNSTATENRLNGLASVNKNKKRDILENRIGEYFAKIAPRILQLSD